MIKKWNLQNEKYEEPSLELNVLYMPIEEPTFPWDDLQKQY